MRPIEWISVKDSLPGCGSRHDMILASDGRDIYFAFYDGLKNWYTSNGNVTTGLSGITHWAPRQLEPISAEQEVDKISVNTWPAKWFSVKDSPPSPDTYLYNMMLASNGSSIYLSFYDGHDWCEADSMLSNTKLSDITYWAPRPPLPKSELPTAQKIDKIFVNTCKTGRYKVNKEPVHLSNWISVKDRLPEKNKASSHGISNKVLVANNEHIFVAFFNYNFNEWSNDYHPAFIPYDVTHWMLLPELPSATMKNPPTSVDKT